MGVPFWRPSRNGPWAERPSRAFPSRRSVGTALATSRFSTRATRRWSPSISLRSQIHLYLRYPFAQMANWDTAEDLESQRLTRPAPTV
jgi:hypothetical protein